MIKLTREDLLQLINEIQSLKSELDNIEVKAAAKGAPKVYDSLSSLSNRVGGGIIIFGLDEDNDFQAIGVYDLNDLRTKIGEATSQMEPPVRPAFTSIRLQDDAVILAMEIPECPVEFKPCFYKPAGLHGGSFIRVADGDRRMTEYEVYMFLSSRSQAQDDVQPVVKARPEDLDEAAIVRYIEIFRERRPQSRLLALPYEQLLRRMNILTEYKGELKPTLAGMLMFGQFPQQFYPSLFVAFVVLAGTTSDERGPRGERFLDNRRVEGTIPEMIGETEKAIQYNMRRSTVVSGFVRQDIDEYPREAVREAIINALAHRDYSHYALGTHIQIQMFTDRLEIANQGGLYGHLSEDGLGIDAPTTRNAALMRMMEDLDIVENRGSGIRAMVESMRAVHLAPPHFKDAHTSFRVTFYNHTLLNQETLDWLQQFKDLPLNDNQRFALAYLRRNHSILTNHDYQRLSGVDSVQATRELGYMVKLARVLMQHGTRGGAYYTLRKQEPEQRQELFPTSQLSDNETRVIAYIKANGYITNSLCRELLTMRDKDAANYLLTNMYRRNLIKRKGKGRSTRYSL